MDQNVIKPSIIRQIRQSSLLKNLLIRYLILILISLGLPFMIVPFFQGLSIDTSIIFLFSWGLSSIFLVNLVSTFKEYQKAVRLDHAGIQILVTLKDKYDIKSNSSKWWDRDEVTFTYFIFFENKSYLLEYELPGNNYFQIYVPKKMYLYSEVGKKIFVRYLCDYPEVQRIEGLSDE
jgi:hypothetical protein